MIRCIYTQQPDFPATDQHPDAKRSVVKLGDVTYWVDALGPAPTWQDVARIVAPSQPVPQEISDRQFVHALKNAGIITFAEALAFVQTGTIPAALQKVLDGIPYQEQREDAELLLAGATVFRRDHPTTEALRVGMGWTSEQTDDLWRAGAAL